MPELVDRILVVTAIVSTLVWAQSKPSVSVPASNPKPVTSQGTGRPPANSKASEQATALALLESLFAATNDFEDQELKITAEGQIADLLWNYDQLRSRKLFSQVLEAVNTIKEDDRELAFLKFMRKARLRAGVLSLISHHDPAWAKSLLEEFAKQDTSEADSGFPPGDSGLVERMQLAVSSMDSDPEYAAQILKSVAADLDWAPQGLSATNIFRGALGQLRKQRADLADQVVLEAIAGAQAKPSTTFFSLPAIQECIWPVLGNVNDPNGANIIRAYLVMAQPIVLSSPSDEIQPTKDEITFANRKSQFPEWRQMLLAMYDEYMPAIAPLIHKQLNGVPPMNSRHSAWWSHLAGDVVHYQDEAAGANDAQKDQIYGDSASLLAQNGHIDDAFSSARSIQDDQFRSVVMTTVRQYAVDQAATKDDARAIYQYAQQEPGIERVDMLMKAISAAMKKKEFEFAGNLLNETEAWLRQNAEGGSDPRIWLKLCALGARIDVNRGFQIMRSAVKVINETEFMIPGEQPQQTDKRVFSLASNRPTDRLDYGSFTTLGRADFPMTLALAQDIQKREISVFAQLAVCQAVLNEDASPKSRKSSS